MDASRGRVAPRKEKNKDLADYVCTVCGATTAKLKYCVSCKTTRYCSKECQVVDWRDRGHKAICEKIRADREAEAKRSEAPTPPSSPKPERPVFYGPAERTYADEERARIKANFEAARAWREANPEPEPGPYGRRCPVCLDDWDVNKSPNFCYFCLARTCDSCATKSINTRGEMCPMCQESPPPGLQAPQPPHESPQGRERRGRESPRSTTAPPPEPRLSVGARARLRRERERAAAEAVAVVETASDPPTPERPEGELAALRALDARRLSPAALDASMELLPDLLRRCAIERARRAAAEDAGTECVVCLEDARSVAFGCGHLCVCEACAPTVVACPLCREPVRAKQRIYFD